MDKEIPDNIIERLIECGRNAPSSLDCQPWHFIIVKGKVLKGKLAKIKGEENEEAILAAYVLIVVCVDKKKSPSRFVEDGITATENILLAAHDLGLGAVYITGFKPSKPEIEEEIKKILKLPENIIPITILPVGYPDSSEKLEKKELCRSDDVIHLERG